MPNAKVFASPPDLPTPAGFSHVVRFAADEIVWTAGQVPLDANGNAPPADDWEAQTRLAFENVARALEAGGATLHDVVKLTFYVTDTSSLEVVRKVRDEFIDISNPPTSSLVQVAGLLRPDLLIEIEAVASVR